MRFRLVAQGLASDSPAVSLEEIRQEITSWDRTLLRKLIAYAVVLENRQTPGFAQSMASKLENPDPARWISLPELDARLGFRPDELEE